MNDISKPTEQSQKTHLNTQPDFFQVWDKKSAHLISKSIVPSKTET